MNILTNFSSYMIASLLSALLLIGCFSDDPLPENPFEQMDLPDLYENLKYGQEWKIIGDTSIVSQDVLLHSFSGISNVAAISSNTGLEYVAIGGSFTSGARDGGLYRNAQLTSFPNLLARQMNISTFSQPLFGKDDFNGFGYKVTSTQLENRVPQYAAVRNNLSIEATDPEISLKKYTGLNIHNLGVPFLGSYGLGWLPSYPPRNSLGYKLKASIPFLSRFVSQSNENTNSVYKMVLDRKFDFFTIEIGTHNFLEGNNTDIYQSAQKPVLLSIIEYLNEIQAKGCIANIPDVTEFPYFGFISPIEVRTMNLAELYVDDNGAPLPVPNDALLLPTPTIDSLMNLQIDKTKKTGLSYDNPLPSGMVWLPTLVSDTQNSILRNNEVLKNWANTYNYPIVNLYELFKQVYLGQRTTHDGVMLSTENFFSSDGINLSPFGQAVLANEFIKTTNEFYNTSISLVPTIHYLSK